MKRRFKAGGEPIKGPRRKTPKPKRRNASKTTSSFAPVHDTEVARLTRELNEALERQAATSEVLRVISTSPSELEPVFGAILANGARLCEANFGILALYENGAFHVAGMHNVPEAYAEYRRLNPVINLGPQSASARMAVSKEVIHHLDYAAELPEGPAVRLAGARSVVAVPMLKDSGLVGTIFIYRQEVRAFTDTQIALLENFAAQAVIAIENARLLTELRQSLEQQTATSDVLQVISSSPGDLEPVFASMLEKAVRICDAAFGNIYRWDDAALHLVATRNTPPAFAEARRYSLFKRPRPKTVTGRMLASQAVVHVADATAEPGYGDKATLTLLQPSISGTCGRYLPCPCGRRMN
jgi:hypothetical protein